MPIKLLFFVLLGVVGLASCQVENQTEDLVRKDSQTQPPKETKTTEILLTDENARTELLKYGKENIQNEVLIKTRFGNMKVRLYEETPLHRANFLRLVQRKYFDNTFFYRVIKDFIVQGGMANGNPVPLGKYGIPKEFMPRKYYHKKGALGMARDKDQGSFQKKSSAQDFFIVHGKTYSLGELLVLEQEHNWIFTPKQIETYRTIGGAPHLDNNYTVFGEVIEGLHIIDSIANQPIDEMNWLLEDIAVKMEVIDKK